MQSAVIWWPLIGLLGAAVGSFVNVVALRWSDDRGFTLKNRSRCPHCRRILRWFELIPVVSYIIQRGRCRDCGQRLSIRYLLVELGLAFVFVSLLGASQSWIVFLLLTAACTLLSISFLVDLEYRLLPDVLTLGFIAIAVLTLLVTRSPNLFFPSSNSWGASWWSGVLIGGGGLGCLYVLTRGRGMGLGDVKLAAAFGLSLGGAATLFMLGVAFVLGAIVGVGLMLAGRATLKSALPFGPFLILGWWLVLIWGAPILWWYTTL